MEEGRTAWAPDVDVLNRIGEPAMDLVIWERRLPPDLQTWLVSLRVDQLPCGRMLVGRTDIRDALDALFASSGTPDGPPANALLHDIVDVAERFAAVAECDPIDIRLDVVDHDACWKFHRDNVDLRLLTTYVGPGTQYVTPGNAERAIDRQKAYDGPIEHVPEQAVALFKGALCASGTGVVHRSPPIAGSGETRLLLCLNSPSHASPELWRRYRKVHSGFSK